jgi:hypothetical protein
MQTAPGPPTPWTPSGKSLAPQYWSECRGQGALWGHMLRTWGCVGCVGELESNRNVDWRKATRAGNAQFWGTSLNYICRCQFLASTVIPHSKSQPLSGHVYTATQYPGRRTGISSCFCVCGWVVCVSLWVVKCMGVLACVSLWVGCLCVSVCVRVCVCVCMSACACLCPCAGRCVHMCVCV